MKFLQSSVFRALCAMIVGVLLIEYREQMVTWLTIAIGVLFFLSGVISLATYYSARKHAPEAEACDEEGNPTAGAKPSFPLAGTGSLVLGAIFALMPSNFVTGLVYVLSLMLVIGAVSQFVSLASASRTGHVGWFFWVMPSVILLVSIVAIVYPAAIQADPLFVIGWCMLLYGVVECTNAVKIHNEQRKYAKAQEASRKAAEEAENARAQEQAGAAAAEEPEAGSAPTPKAENPYYTHTPTQPME
ncbi:hypothetical protein C7120_06795 [Prevotella sp. oral taxon 376]|uniref:HdeD family acid-resistance protein n=1 Tax=Prevotella sp. oral taxon 376 TaxID=712466 RepID=UPI000D1D69C4|nr:DUF308 domain-containing protein [Prevotella sp. oral taxon 376]PTL34240.1 hypothetical protein C7120_06795 [Prevotella sp. oral taxon 376]